MLARWNRFDREFDTLFGSLMFNDSALPTARFAGPEKLLAPADVVETAHGFEVKVDLPGHDPKSIDVKVDKDTLVLSSERKADARHENDQVLRVERVHGAFSRSFSLPKNVDAQHIEAKYEHGVLSVFIPKREEEKPRTIQVKVG